MLIRYLAGLSKARMILWCYLLWYVVVVARYFEPDIKLWLTSVGLSLIIGTGLVLNAISGNTEHIRLEKWQTLRFYMVPFCVSSFSALVKGKGFILVFSPNPADLILQIGLCLMFSAAWTMAQGRSSH